MRDTIEVKERLLPFQAQLDDSGPLAAFHEPGHGTPYKLGSLPAALLHKIRERPADNLLEGGAEQIGKTAVDGANLSVQRKAEQNAVSNVHHLSNTLLRLAV